jgi:hypothetical protein
MLTFCEVELLEMAADLTKFVKFEHPCTLDQQSKIQTVNQCAKFWCFGFRLPECFS